MKKLTKLTALALALALLLGMTAMAGTPSEVILTDDFSDATDLTWATFGASRSKLSAPYNYNSYQAYVAVEGQNKYYYDTGAALVNVNGKMAIEDTASGARTNRNTLLYTVPGGFDLEDANDGAYALVAQIGWTPVEIGAAKAAYGHVGHSGPIVSTVTQDGATTVTSKGYSSLGYESKLATETDGANVTFRTGNLNGHQAYNMSNPVYEGEESVIRHVVRNTWRTNTGESENEIITEDAKKSLNMISYVGRNMLYSGRPLFRNNAATDQYITSFDGFWFASPEGIKNRWSDFVMYKLSMDRNDFVYETASMTTSNISIDGNMEIVLSQPISTTTINFCSTGNMVDILPLITVTTGEGEDMVTLTYGEDYTIEVSERIVGTAIKGIMTIKPLNNWAYDTAYTVTVPYGLASAARIAMLADNNTPIVFTTEKAPAYAITLNAYKGLAATGTALEALEAGTTYFAVSAAHTEGKAVANGTIRIEILEDGAVVGYVTAKKAIGSAATFGAAVKLAAGQTAKAYVVGANGEATID